MSFQGLVTFEGVPCKSPITEMQEPQQPTKAARNMPIMVTVPRDLVSIRYPAVPIMLGIALCLHESCPTSPASICQPVFCYSSAVFSGRWTLLIWLWEKKRQLPFICSTDPLCRKRLAKVNNFMYSMTSSNVLVYRKKVCDLTNLSHYIPKGYGAFWEVNMRRL